MRLLIWIVAIFAIAVGIAVLANANEGYVLIVSPPWRAQVSTNFAILALIVAFFAFYALIRLVRKTLRLPERVAQYRERRCERKESQALHRALRALYDGRFSDALSHAKTADKVGGKSFEVALIAARAAHALNDERRCAEWLDRAAEREGGQAPRLLAQASFALDDGKLEIARSALEELRGIPHRSVATTRLGMELARAQGRWDEVLRLVPELRSQKVITDEEARSLTRAARLADFRAKAGDEEALLASWRELSKQELADRALVAGVLPLLADVGQGPVARRTVERLLDAQWDSALARQYFACAGEGVEATEALRRAERWLPEHPGDAGLLASLGRQCMAAQVWGKAQGYLEESLARDPRPEVHATLASLFERLERKDEAARHYREAARLATAA
ncbi:MAG TPA: heme biosynthesis HemY N-terminal domain-containing protein [Azoarcus sp.]|nr:heme biosynthesis HemY N-terminal domain-containing protein [Azoarcus sp.]